MPKNLKSIGQDAFKDCKYLEKIIFEENSELSEIAKTAFKGCTNIREATFSNDYQLEWFRDADLLRQLEKVTLQEGLKSVPEECFLDGQLVEVRIPKSVQTIEENAFYDCGKL